MQNTSPFTPLLQDVLRLGDEPYRYYRERDIHQLLSESPAEYFNFSKTILDAIARKESSLELPPKQIYKNGESGGDFRIMPCVLHHNNHTVKTVKLVGTNLNQALVPGQITVGKAFAIHPEENFISHIFEACLLSSARTGLCASLAVQLLTEAPREMAIVGTGRVGYYTALYTAATSPIKTITLIDTDADRARATANQLSKDLPEITVNHSADITSVATSEVLVLATTSTEPLCAPTDTSAKLVISLGADTDEQHELAPDWPIAADIFVDTLDSSRYGDLRQWQTEGLLHQDNLTDLLTILRTPPEKESPRRRVFISTGSALFDNLTIAYLLSKEQHLQPD